MTSMESGDWRAQLQDNSRNRIVNKIIDTLKKHHRFSRPAGLQQLRKTAWRLEQKIYIAATSQSDYLRKISLKMLTVEARSQNPMPYVMQANFGANNVNPSDPGSQVMQQVNRQRQPRPILLPSNHPQPKQQLLSQNMHNNIGSNGMQAIGDSSTGSGNWRSQLQPDSRQKIVNKIMDTLKMHGDMGLQEVEKIAVRFEEKIYTAATSQSDYLRKISLKMVTMETKSQNSMPDSMQANSGANTVNTSDQGVDNNGVVVDRVHGVNPYKRDAQFEIVGNDADSKKKRMNEA